MSQPKKCIVWDLDNTLWEGVCLEGAVTVRKEVVAAIQELDRRGILHAVASRGDEETAKAALRSFGLDVYFLALQINWLPKSQSIVRIAKELGLSLDSLAYVDDDRFEREQVSFMLPEVMTIDAREADRLPGLLEFTPAIVTGESRKRRALYQAEFSRKRSEQAFGTREEFLRSCAMKLRIRPMNEEDLPRVLELMTRTHQLNTTGRLVEQGDLVRMLSAPAGSPRVLVAELEDKFGEYGCIGTAMVSSDGPVMRLLYLAVSCRVMGRGIERSIIAWIARAGQRSGASWLEADFQDTGKNRMMRALYQMEGLREVPEKNNAGTRVFRAECAGIPEAPPWVEVG